MTISYECTCHAQVMGCFCLQLCVCIILNNNTHTHTHLSITYYVSRLDNIPVLIIES